MEVWSGVRGQNAIIRGREDRDESFEMECEIVIPKGVSLDSIYDEEAPICRFMKAVMDKKFNFSITFPGAFSRIKGFPAAGFDPHEFQGISAERKVVSA